MVGQVKTLRVAIDSLAQLTKGLEGQVFKEISFYLTELKFSSKETTLAVDSLYFAKAWLGKVLAELGTENPYKAEYKTKEDIEPTADKADSPLSNFLTSKGDWNEITHIEKIYYLRNGIEMLIADIRELPTHGLSREFAIARTNAYTHLCEAKFWLGFELERIKNEK